MKRLFLLPALLFLGTAFAVAPVQGNMLLTQTPYTINDSSYYPITFIKGFRQQGKASWYGPKFHGQLTSNGEVFDMYAMTAAHKELPMDTLLQVRNLENGKEVVVRINDRGPFVAGRIIDLSYAAAQSLDMVEAGTAPTEISVISQDDSEGNTADELEEPSKREYYVQIGAFSQPDNAQRMQQYFHNAGYTAIIRPCHMKAKSDSLLHLVQIYVGEDYQHARAEHALLKGSHDNAFLIAYQQKG